MPHRCDHPISNRRRLASPATFPNLAEWPGVEPGRRAVRATIAFPMRAVGPLRHHSSHKCAQAFRARTACGFPTSIAITYRVQIAQRRGTSPCSRFAQDLRVASYRLQTRRQSHIARVAGPVPQAGDWHPGKGSNLQPSILEIDALPVALPRSECSEFHGHHGSRTRETDRLSTVVMTSQQAPS